MACCWILLRLRRAIRSQCSLSVRVMMILDLIELADVSCSDYPTAETCRCAVFKKCIPHKRLGSGMLETWGGLAGSLWRPEVDRAGEERRMSRRLFAVAECSPARGDGYSSSCREMKYFWGRYFLAAPFAL